VHALTLGIAGGRFGNFEWCFNLKKNKIWGEREKWGAEWRVKSMQTQEQGPPLSPAEN
jgi:hypothetical protein